MFRDKNFLIERGLYEGCREDTCYIIGMIYDEVIDTGIFNLEKIEELRIYLDKNREVINNKDYSITLTDSVVKRFKESFLTEKKEKEVKKKEEKPIEKIHYEVYNMQYLLENNSIRKIYTDWENKTGVYGIFVEDKLMYIGSTKVSFKERFLEHKNFLKNKTNKMYLYKQLSLDLMNNYKIEFKPLVVIEDLQMLHKKVINEKELKSMELALITVFQPKYNIAGRLQPFNFG